MDVVLQENYPSLGYVGDLVKVKRGFARNFLIPRGIAVDANSSGAKILNHKLFAINAKKAKLKAEAETYAKILDSVALDFTLKAGDQGRSFGSVTAKDIETALKARGYVVDKKQVRIIDPIRTGGTFKVTVKLHSEVSAQITLNVTAEKIAKSYRMEEADEAAPAVEGEEGVEAAPTEKKPKKARGKKDRRS